MVANNGRYYLIANYEKYDNISHYRIDHITGISMRSEPARKKSDIKEFANGFNLPRHMAEHVYMYSGESITVKLAADVSMMDQLVDWFGRNFSVDVEENGRMTVTLKCNEEAMLYWALQYGEHVEIKEPKRLRERMKEVVGKISDKYRE
jgi:predicted DNA-binding transcriptional regulator YafY